jgi:carnitine O-acetyltransferase
MIRQTPLCMASYKYLFNSSKIPAKPVDTAHKYDPNTHNHIVVLRNNRFYEVSVVDEKGEFLSEADFEQSVVSSVSNLPHLN